MGATLQGGSHIEIKPNCSAQSMHVPMRGERFLYNHQNMGITRRGQWERSNIQKGGKTGGSLGI